jgi:biotin carboxylase
MQSILLVETSIFGPGPILTKIALDKGLKPIVLLRDMERAKRIDARAHTAFLPPNFDELLSLVFKLIEENPIAGVVTVHDDFTLWASKLALALNLPGPTPESVQLGQNKQLQKTELMRGKVRTPQAIYFNYQSDLNQFPAMVRKFPVVVKPVRGSDSAGVSICRSPSELTEHIKKIEFSAAPNFSEEESGFLIEEYIVGEEYAVEIFDGHAIGLIKKRMAPGDNFIETGYTANPPISRKMSLSLCSTAVAACQAIGLTWGPAHVDLIASDEGPSVIEVNPRIAGSFIPELINDAYEFDLIDHLLQRAMGADCLQQHKLNANSNRIAAVDFILSPSDGSFLENLNGYQTQSDELSKFKIKIGKQPFPPKRRLGHVYYSFDAKK